ncbi:amino acid adenylation domain-containing protein, partial [Duganella sp. HSC-15S17]
ETSVSYGELNARANRLAHTLIGLGVKPDDRVAICVERSVEMIVGLLGILKAGGAYVPLDPSYPQERLACMLQDSTPVALLTQTGMQERLPAAAEAGLAIPVLLLDGAEDGAAMARQASHNPHPAQLGLTARHLAYVIYTSGSTGVPKGVMVEHQSVLNLWIALEQTVFLHRQKYSRIALNAEISFDASIKVLVQLLSGHCIAPIPQSVRKDGAALIQFISEYKIDVFDCTPAQLELMLFEGLLNKNIDSPKVVLVGGEAISAATWAKLRNAKNIHFYNLYGPTECTVDATIADLKDSGEFSHIGRPIANTQLYILDAHLQPVPVGVTGEIYIGGAGVARGYLNRPELTAERFLPDPFSAQAEARLYKSGDLGRWLADGNIEYVGRNDFQVKIRGFRIELGEIEARLAACEGVRAAIVIAREDQPGDKRLVAYVIAQAGAEEGALSATNLREQLSASLAEYMVPSAFVTLDAFPLTANGKLDRKALPAPDKSAVVSRAYEAPQGEIEEALAQIWQDLLGLARIGRHDHFFEMGGHSLMAVQLVSRLRQVLDVEVPLRDLFAQPTLAGLATTISNAMTATRGGNLVPIRSEGGQRPLFLIHPGKGEIGYARDIAPWIDAEIPIYGLAARGFLSGEVPLATVEEMAECYLREIRKVQPSGPYRLAGWSAGGTIAYEIAHQLISVDERVEFLGLIDTASDYQFLRNAQSNGQSNNQEVGEADEIAHLLARLPENTPLAIHSELAALAQAKEIDAMLRCCQVAEILPQEIEVDLLRRYLAVTNAITTALCRYTRPQISVPITLFAASVEHRLDASLGWKYVAGHRLHMTQIGGNHFTMMQSPHIETLGAAISHAIAQAGQEIAHHREHCVTIQPERAA